MSTQEDDFVGRFLNGALTDDELLETGRVLENRSLVDKLVRHGRVHHLLQRHAARLRSESQAKRLLARQEGQYLEADRTVTTADGEKNGSRNRAAVAGVDRRRALVALAAALAIAGLLVWGDFGGTKLRSMPEIASPAVAQISRSINIVFPADAHRWSVGDVLHAGDILELAGGRAELVFDSGAIMTVVGPAHLEMRSPTTVALQSGTATTRVDSALAGEFRVLTPATNVIDLGTEFGVRVEPDGKTDVVVFEGSVDLKPTATGGTQLPERRLFVGEALRAGGATDWEPIVSVESDAFPFGDSLFHVKPNRRPVIVGISDDLRPADDPRFYRIHHEGLREDARAYVDKMHEWNGVTEEGIPKFLLGADYIETFNRNKSERAAITVELAGPSMVYVFYCDRMPLPDWLHETFEDTGFDIGLDRINTETGLDVGPARSVDEIFSIWRRRIDESGPVELGRLPLGWNPADKTTPRHMFGIAAQPLSVR